ncbi:MAG: MFS transporter [Caldilineaceae bacterium]|nr:MFS transporter [Caldilineaceae bacterium]
MDKVKGPSRRWLSVIGLAAGSFVDGGEDQSISILWPFMYRSLQVSIGQLGTVLGLSRLIMALTLPLWGYAADRFSRKTLLVCFTGFWGAWTLAISLVETFPQLLIVRLLSTLGLGIFIPAAFSLIGDLFGDQERGRAVGVITATGVVGTVTAFIVLPAIAANDAEAWRTGFMLMGSASIVTGLLLLLVEEPPRGASEPEIQDVISRATARRYLFHWRDLRLLLKVQSWRWLLLSELLLSLGVGIVSGWAFTWLDSLGLGESASLVVGLMALGSIGGAILFGWVGDVVEARFPNYGRIALVLAGKITLLPTLIFFVTANAENVVLLTILGALFGLAQATVGKALQWPLAQAVLLPELRASGRAAINIITGLTAALMLTLSGALADRVGVPGMLLYIVPLPALLSIVVWLPMFNSYARDRAILHTILSQRRMELLGAIDHVDKGSSNEQEVQSMIIHQRAV